MSCRYHVLLIYVLLALGSIVFSLSPLGHGLEERFGLALLFKLRGPRLPPERVVIVNVDDRSSRLFGFPDDYSDWPRSLYARLLDTVIAHGAAVVVFDIHFAEERDPVDDRLFAEAIRRAGRVILCERLIRQPADDSPGIPAEIERRVPPAPLFADAAVALAPFPIPKVPIRVNRVWTFKTSAGEVPTLPVVPLQILALDTYPQLYRLIGQMAPERLSEVPKTANEVVSNAGLVETMFRIRTIFQQSEGRNEGDHRLSEVDSVTVPAILASLLTVYRGDDNMYLDYYGPPATVTTVASHDLLAGNSGIDKILTEQIRDAVVFVGAARTTWAEQKDGFYTVFSRKDGLDLSGVEIAATACANLLENRRVQPLSPLGGALLSAVLAIGCALAGLCLPALTAVGVLIVAAAAYLIGALSVFAAGGWWLPTIVPLVLIFPGAVLFSIVSSLVLVRHERQQIEQALRCYLPSMVVEQVTRGPEMITAVDKTVYGVCLLSDAQNYTTLSEQLSPADLSVLLNRYYDVLYQEVRKYDGLVCNVIGDAMFAIWSSTGQRSSLKIKACRAAVGIQEAVRQFNRGHPDQALPTRIGLHAGYLLMGNIGATGHYEYAPVGDIANTVARIENLNKQFDTSILVSAEAFDEKVAVPNRLLGTFLLGGKSKPVTVFELIPHHEDNRKELEQSCQLFSAALGLFHRCRWEQAASVFERCLDLRPDDGPARFYLQRCSLYRLTPPPHDWQGVIHLAKF